MPRLFWLFLPIAFCLSVFLQQGCSTTPGIDNGSTTNTTPSANQSPYWTEVEGRFYTNDIIRAQAEIPFQILLPAYIPQQEYASLPMIDGPLQIHGDESEIEINIKYRLCPINGIGSHIFITEGNQPISGHGNAIEIGGKTVIKWEGTFSLGSESMFLFSHDNIYFVVEVYNRPIEEAIKVVESMIIQLE